MDVKSTFKIGIMILLASTLLGCEDESTPPCIQGRVIGYQACYNVNVIQILSGSLRGDKLYGEANNTKMLYNIQVVLY